MAPQKILGMRFRALETGSRSGPTMVSAISASAANPISASMFSASIATFSSFGSSAVPALPGATNTRSTRASCAHFQAKACSRPPPPTMSTFIGLPHS
jgi:hypothetical protein